MVFCPLFSSQFTDAQTIADNNDDERREYDKVDQVERKCLGVVVCSPHLFLYSLLSR